MLQHCTFRLMQFLFSSIKYIVQNEFVFSKNKREEEPILQDFCASYMSREDVEVSHDDANVVLKRLGIITDNKWHNHSLIEGANELLENKVASVEELKEAFEVFDNDSDGFITPKNLLDLMNRLGLSEGMRHEDCERMIRVYDTSGDGKINFNDFKHMMEKAE